MIVEGPDIMPFVQQFCGLPAMFLWESDDGTVHHEQGEGGELGDPLMAFLDDVYISTDPVLQQAYGG